ncbi:MAG TPA: FtsW/RodA/SpoVE family cell cycle protein [Aggregatilineales bacterium]|nr:FtsW/RodA/SpoVE family cell cycle protein [Aggregatilineales bacterium]
MTGITATTQVGSRSITDEPGLRALTNLREILLLALAGVFLLLIQTGLIVAQNRAMGEYWHLVVWVGGAAGGHLILRRRLPYRDALIFPIVMLLTGWGLVAIDRSAPDFASRQSIWLVISLAVMSTLVLAPHHLRWLSRYRYLWLVSGLFLLALTIVIGRNPSTPYGPRLWLGIFDAYFQPSELLKVLLIVFLSSYLAEYQEASTVQVRTSWLGVLRLPSLQFLGPLLLMWGISGVVLLWQQDLGTATLFFVVFVAMLYISTGQISYVIEAALLIALAASVGYRVFGVVRLRVDIWLNPWPEADSRAYQIVSSLLAFSAGGVVGTGVGQGSPTYVPVVHSDFIFAAIGEEWGLIGTLAVTACLALLVVRALRSATNVYARPFRSYLATGIAITTAAQSLLIMGGVLKLIPLTGVTLPFLSYGGSSLLVNFAMIGLLLVVSDERSP